MPQTITVPLGALKADQPTTITVPLGALTSAEPAKPAPKPPQPNQVGEMASEIGHAINPVEMVQGLYGMASNLVGTVQGMGATHERIFHEAKAAYDKGDYPTAARKFVNYLVPIIGPITDKSADQFAAGRWGAGTGTMVGLGAQTALPGAVSKVASVRLTPAISSTLNPAEAAAVRFGQAEGIPIDAATATGNRFVRGVQKVADESLLGSGIGARARQGQAEALTATGERLAEATHPTAVTAEQAGQGVTDAVKARAATLNADANTAYSNLRALEAKRGKTYDPEEYQHGSSATFSEFKQGPHGAVYLSKPEAGRATTQAEAIARGPFGGNLYRVSVDSSKLKRFDPLNDPASRKIYEDLFPGKRVTDLLDYTEMPRVVEATKAKGYNAFRVHEPSVQGESLAVTDPSALRITDRMAPNAPRPLSVELRPVKAALKPAYETLLRESKLVPLMGDKAKALTALDRLMSAPDMAPLSVADSALSDLKAMARVDDAFRRTTGQGVAAQAVSSLDKAVVAAAKQGGQPVFDALMQGRAATINKFKTIDVVDALRAEPVVVFNQLTAGKDSAVALLRRVKREAPGELPKMGRAYLEGLLTKATAEGGFGKADALFADWQRLGPQTKQLLFKDPALVKDLDNFFLLAKRIAENPNPSGTALTVFKGGEMMNIITNPTLGIPLSLSGAGLAKLLHSPSGVKLLTQGLRLPAVNKVGAKLATVELAKVAREQGVSLVPVTAEDQGP